MEFLELSDRKGRKYLFNMASGWQIYDGQGADKPAHITNPALGRTLDCEQTYEEIRSAVYKNTIRVTKAIS